MDDIRETYIYHNGKPFASSDIGKLEETIKQLQAKLGDLQWIPVSEGLPKDKKENVLWKDQHLRLDEVKGPRCSKHPFYRVTRSPIHDATNCNCSICWDLWRARCEEQEAKDE